MEWNIGVEMRNEYRRMELARAAMKLVRDIMLCKPGENLVITYDTCVDERVVHALTEAAYTIESVPTVIYYPTAEASMQTRQSRWPTRLLPRTCGSS